MLAAIADELAAAALDEGEQFIHFLAALLIQSGLHVAAEDQGRKRPASA